MIAAARFTSKEIAERLRSFGIETITTDLLEPGALAGLPDAAHVIYMAAKKFGTTGAEHLTWAMNAYLPGLVAQRFQNSRIVAFSTGNVYALRDPVLGGATDPIRPRLQASTASRLWPENGCSSMVLTNGERASPYSA